MPNSSNTFKTGETVLFEGEYECLNCRSLGKKTVKKLSPGKIFPYCDGCETKDATWRLTGKLVTR